MAQASRLKEKITSLTKKLTKLCNPHKVHQKKRLLFNLKEKLQKLQTNIDLEKIPLCFGSKHLFQQQFYLQENGYQNHEEWFAGETPAGESVDPTARSTWLDGSTLVFA